VNLTHRSAVLVVTGATAMACIFGNPAFARSTTATDKQAATAALLQLSELPAGDPARGFRGWQEISAGGSDVLRLGFPDLAFKACAATIKVEKASEKYRADTGDYDSNSDDIRNSIYVFPNAKKAKRYIATYTKPAERECYQHSVTVGNQMRLAGSLGPIAAPAFPDFDASTVPSGSVNEGVALSAWWSNNEPGNTDPDGETIQEVRFRSGRAVIELSTYYSISKGPAPAFFPGTAGYVISIANRLRTQLSK
jgi:hypothetical protein